jgi:hypothetical protein
MLATLTAFLLSAAVLSAQAPIITNRLATTTMRGTIVEVTCFRQQGAATVGTPEQMGCAKKRVAEDGRLGILTEGDGLFQITGVFAANSNEAGPVHQPARRSQRAEVIISNNYDYKSFDAEKIAKVKEGQK